MGVVFPLSVGGKVVLILIAGVIILIWSMLKWPGKWRWLFDKLRENNGTNGSSVSTTAPPKKKSKG